MADAEEAPQKPLPLEPFVRHLLLQMDNCVGTNKSQFCFGGLAILMLLGLLDSIEFAFMVVGHTKFIPDIICRHIAGRYIKQDCFNLGMLLECVNNYANGVAYNEHNLRTWKEASKEIFSEVPNITIYRYFMVIGADGEFGRDLGDGVEKGAVEAPETTDYPSAGRCYSDKKLNDAREKLAARSLVKVIEQIRAKKYHGVGSGQPKYGGRTNLIQLERSGVVVAVGADGATVDVKYEDGTTATGLPVSIVGRLDKTAVMSVGSKVDVRVGLPDGTEVRPVRLFCRMRELDRWWIETASYHKTSARTLDTVNAALLKSTTYANSSVEGQCPNEPYGAKKQSIEKNYANYVPANNVPDRFALAQRGLSGSVGVATQTLIIGEAEMRLAKLRDSAAPLEIGDVIEHKDGSEWKKVNVCSVNRSETPQEVGIGSLVMTWPDSDELREAPSIPYDKKLHDHDLVVLLGGFASGDKNAAAVALGVSRIAVISTAVSRLLQNGHLAGAGAGPNSGSIKVCDSKERVKKAEAEKAAKEDKKKKIEANKTAKAAKKKEKEAHHAAKGKGKEKAAKEDKKKKIEANKTAKAAKKKEKEAHHAAKGKGKEKAAKEDK
eukprot:CAMPEP_0171806452 /NCGR_PEP_ID=MMETSP0991-20121206/75310_1 /TAXON_ID=483369 /ORGANISM="non described non described, Strain CCMP2098" /LENGTH=605 /DNA_ID=CAMNT_0012419209 /DNA_START=358 /DNA_END=2172 /DNA_ORIENTATION=-